MNTSLDHKYLVKFIVAGALAFFVGSIHGVLQVQPDIRAWLDSVGSPYGGPGHMIDPLAHAHINLIGGVTILVIALSYYLLTIIYGKALPYMKMANFSFWVTTIGIYSFYTVLVGFGIWEGQLLLAHSDELEDIHSNITKPFVLTTAMIMGVGLWSYMLAVVLSVIKYKKNQNE